MSTSSKRDERKLKIATRRAEALKLRTAGASYDTIAERLNYADGSNARRDIQAALKDVIREPAQEVLTLELSRLDQMLLGLYRKAIGGDVAAVDRVIRIMDRRAAYLGIDAPKESSVDIKTDSRERILSRLEVLAAASRAAEEVPGGTK